MAFILIMRGERIGSKFFSLAIVLLLFAELFSPFAFAAPSPSPSASPSASPGASASPSPSATPEPISTIAYPSDFSSKGGSCTSSSITDEQRRQLWDNTLTSPITQLTDSPLNSVLNSSRNNPEDFFNEDPSKAKGVSAIDPYFQKTIPLAQVAPLLIDQRDTGKFKDTGELLKFIGVSWDDTKENSTDVINDIYVSPAQLNELGQKKKGSAQKTTDDILAQLGLGPGKTGGLNAPTPTPQVWENKKIPIPGRKEPLTFEQVAASYDLNPESCLLDGVINGKVGYLAILDSDVSYGNVNNQVLSGEIINSATGEVDPELSDPHGKNQKFTGTRQIGYLKLNGGANVLIPSFYEHWLVAFNTINTWQLGLSLGVGLASGGANKALAEAKKIKGELRDVAISEENALGRQVAAGAASPATVARHDHLLATSSELEQSVTEYTKYQGFLNRVATSTSPLVGSSLVFAFGWQGPARLLFQVNEGLILSTTKDPNQYVKVIVNRRFANSFKSASDPFGLGTAQEMLTKYAGVNLGPNKMFTGGFLLLANYPADSSSVVGKSSFTKFQGEDGNWKINTQWTGTSITVNTEDQTQLSSKDAYTSLPLVANNILAEPVVNKQVQGDLYSIAGAIAMPLMVFRGIPSDVGRTLAIGTALETSGLVSAKIDPDYGKSATCDKEELAKLITIYRNWALWGGILQVGLSFVPSILAGGGVAGFLDASSRTLSQLAAYVNPVGIAEMYWGNVAMTYVSNCKDSQYKILAYQQISREGAQNATATASGDKLSSAKEALSALNIFKSTETSSTATDFSKRQEVLNFQVSIADQNGFVAPVSLKRVQVNDELWRVKGGLFDVLNGKACFPEVDKTADGGAFEIGRNGLKRIGKDGKTIFDYNDFYWKLRAASVLRSQALARMIVPNTVITAQLECGGKPFISVYSSGGSILAGKDCPAASCLVQQLKQLVQFDGNNLENVFGKIVSVDTDTGTAMFNQNSISFTKTSVGSIGVEQQVPTVADQQANAELGKVSSGVSLDVLGNGKVQLNAGLAKSDEGITDLGTLRTIIGEKGKIEYDPVAKRLYIFINVLGEGKTQAISDIIARPSTAYANGKTIPVINFDLKGKAGFEDLAKKLQDALNKVQQDSKGGKGGFQVFETPNGTYYIRDDGTIQYVDKKTGQVQNFKLTGSPYTDANGNIVFPTDKGNISFNPGLNDKGQPVINVNGAGIKDEGALEAAKGPGGIFTFNPSTGAITVYNGQDLPMDPRFASQGLGFVGGPDGTHGIPADNPFVLPPVTDQGLERNSQKSLLLPSWPEELPLFALMLSAILVGVLFVRTRRFER